MEDPRTLDNRIHTMPQQGEAWFNIRAGRPTGSGAGRIFTPGGKDAAISSWKNYAIELAMDREYPAHMGAGFYGNSHTDRGNELEPEAIAAFEEEMGLKVEPVGFVMHSNTITGCSPDGMIKDHCGKWIAGYEGKAPLAKKHGKYVLAGGLPDEYRPQVHMSMAVTGLKYWYFCSYLEGRKPFIHLEAWSEYTDAMEDALDRFVIYYADIRKQLAGKI